MNRPHALGGGGLTGSYRLKVKILLHWQKF